MSIPTEELKELNLLTAAQKFNVDEIKFDQSATRNAYRYNTEIWFDFFGIKLTHQVRKTFPYTKVSWLINGKWYTMEVAPIIGKRIDEHEVIHFLCEDAMDSYLRNKINETRS